MPNLLFNDCRLLAQTLPLESACQLLVNALSSRPLLHQAAATWRVFLTKVKLRFEFGSKPNMLVLQQTLKKHGLVDLNFKLFFLGGGAFIFSRENDKFKFEQTVLFHNLLAEKRH